MHRHLQGKYSCTRIWRLHYTNLLQSNNFKYAGLIYYGNCQCGTFLPALQVADSECNAPCNGNPNQMCGADRRFSIYQDPTFPSADPATITSQYTAKGCYSEGTDYRAVPYRQEQLDFDSLTTQQCLAACGQKNYPLAATEYFGECYCGVNLQGGSAIADTASCDTPCNGDDSQTCGGRGYLNLYEAKILQSGQPCGTQPPPPPSTCSGTAYGYTTSIDDENKSFRSLGVGKNWGWVVQGALPVSGTLYLGAGNNDLSKATIVGTFNIDKVGANLVVTYTTSAPWYLGETHFYYSNKNPIKIAPGQFGNSHKLHAGTTQDVFIIPYDATKTTYIIHAAIKYQC
jgi:hypothetical protein